MTKDNMAEPNDADEHHIPVHVHLEVDNDSGRCSPPLAITSRVMIQQFDDVPIIPVGINDVTARFIQTVNTSLLLLQQSHDTDQLLETLRQLQLCLGHDNCDVLHYLEDNQAQLQVISVMQHLPGYLHIQQVCCHILDQMSTKSSKLREAIGFCSIHSYLIQLLEHCKDDVHIQEHATNILADMLESESLTPKLAIDCQQYAIISVVCTAIVNHIGNESVVRAATRALYYLIYKDADSLEFCMESVFDTLVREFHETKDTETKYYLLKIFLKLSEIAKFRVSLVESDIHMATMETCNDLANNEAFMAEALELLSSLNQEENVQTVLSSNSFIHTKLFSSLDVLRLSERVQLAGLTLLESLVPRIKDSPIRPDELSQRLVNMIYTAMYVHIDKRTIQISGCKAIAILIENRPICLQWIGEDVALKQEPVHTLCLGALLVFRKDPEVFVAACEAIYWIAADNERLCTTLMNKNVHVAIIEGLRRHRKIHIAVETGCRALKGLCIFLDLHKKAVVMDGTFAILTDLQTRYEHDVSVQIEVLSIIACLSDIDIVRYQSFVEGVHVKIITSMSRFSDEAMIQEAGLEAFAVLAGADCGADILLSAGALKVTIDSLLNFTDHPLITKKGLIVLQLFASPSMMHDASVRQSIGAVVSSAMKTMNEIKGVQTEVCVAIQLLAEASTEMSEEFVNTGCHEYLFAMLDDTEQNNGLQELASECLYVLSQEQNLKSVMLMSACGSGILPATDCLIELGADVNTGEDYNTPLYLAVANNHEDIVKLLLKHDIQDLNKPLGKSLIQESHVITGLILQFIGYDKQGGSICWTGLNLTAVETSWIKITLTNVLESDSDRDIGRFYIEKIKRSEQKRKNRRLGYSKSDSSIRPHMRLRHPYWFERQRAMNIADMEPKVTQVAPRRSQYFPTRDIRRSQSVEEYLNNSEHGRQRLPTIAATNPLDDSDYPVFDLSLTEAEEWKQTTLTGANVPFNKNDPRQSPLTIKRRDSLEKSQWSRKSSRSPRLSRSSRSSFSSVDEPVSPLLFKRKMSEPVLSSVEHFRLSRKFSIASISEADTMSTSLLYLVDLSENCLTNVEAFVSPDISKHMQKLERLDLSRNKIKILPTDLYKNLPNIQHVDVTDNCLMEFPESLLQCKHLKQLILANNTIKEIKILNFNSSLKKLNLSHNEIKSLPNGIGTYLYNLKELLLNHNDLMNLPETSLGLKMLKTLDLSHNQIDYLPDEFLAVCSELDTIDLSYNIIDRLPNERYAYALPKLTKLKLRRNHLAERMPFYIPRFILELPSLRTLDVSENQITGLPHLTMWTSHVMKDFLASHNRIENLNLENAKVWSKLEKLHLGHNNLAELPREIGQLSSLISLDISHNNITTLPDELGKCSKIYEMPIDGLDLDLDRGLMKRRVRDIISYLHNRLKKAQRFYRMKLMIVGFGGRGKTTLLNTLMKRIPKRKENRPTVGVVVKDWKYTHLERKGSSGDVSQMWSLRAGSRRTEYILNTWDFAGQEEFYSTHNCYLSNRAIYLVVFDVRRGVADVEKLKSWLASIRSRAPSCPVIVVGTHLDKLTRDELKFREESNRISEMLRDFNRTPGFPTINGIHLVDASCENENIETLRKAIKHNVDSFEIRGKRVMGEKIPASYVKLSELISEKAKTMQNTYPVLHHRELQKMVNSEGLDLDEDELQQAVRFLHDAGVLLHYEDASLQLKDYYFIDPGWLCRMMAQVITVRQINPFISKDGILRRKDIDILFKENCTFPEKLIPQYVKLLEKFEIALPHSDTELLIPCRLSSNKPTIHLPSAYQDTISRVYRMPFVPIGLWFRLISRLIMLSTHKGFRSLLKLSEFPRRVCWKKGLYLYWSETDFFLIDSHNDVINQTESIQIKVPSSIQGARILGQIVDHLDNLIDEWYPGLTSIDPLMGQEILEVLAPCRQCHGGESYFTVSEIQRTAAQQDTIICPEHKGEVYLTELAPDLVMGDIEPEFKLDNKFLDFTESSDKQLGDGGFGDVYRAVYKKKDVAVKVFKEIADVHPLTMLRQEAVILRCLNHPSVVSLVAVGIRPPVLLLELASLGTLGTLIKAGKGIARGLQHRIALQVAEGLVYLKQKMIVFRDMKPDNVLIFSTSLTEAINAKISDYGISRFTSYQGLKAQEGTLAYRAPEVIKKEIYSFQADIFSYGLTMYVMLTGRHPFDYLDSKGEMDRAIAEGIAIPPFESKSQIVWPDLQYIVLHCLKYSPDNRPNAKQLYDSLRRPEVYGLQRIIPVSKSTTVECFAVEDTYKRELRLWIASGDIDTFQLSYINLNDLGSKTKGFLFNHGRVMCMQTLGNHFLALGTQFGRVWIFDTDSCTIRHSSAFLQDSVLCMKFMKGDPEDGILLVGIANAKIAIFPVQELLNDPDVDPICLSPGHDFEPVLCMTRLGRRIFLSCGTQLVILHTGKGINIEKIIETEPARNPSSFPIYTMAVLQGQIIFSKKSNTVVEIWNASKERVQRSFRSDHVLGLSKIDARVTAMTADHKSIWIGTHSGHIGIVDVNTLTLLAITHRYMRAVRSLVYVNNTGLSKYRAVFSGGLGFKESQGTQDTDLQSMCGCVLVWDAEYPQYARSSLEYERKRHDLQRHCDKDDVNDADDEDDPK